MKFKVINESINNIDKKNLQILWYEDGKGNKWVPKNGELDGKPKEFIYQNSCFPFILRHDILKEITDKEVQNCDHPKNCLEVKYEDIFQIQRCSKCGGYRKCKIGSSWPNDWQISYGSIPIASFESSWPEDLVLAMANSKDFSLSEAILVCANSCSRCMNALGFKYKLGWGYPEFSKEWQNSNTVCQYCQN